MDQYGLRHTSSYLDLIEFVEDISELESAAHDHAAAIAAAHVVTFFKLQRFNFNPQRLSLLLKSLTPCICWITCSSLA